jgi:polysaccharide export outer membrane protein
VVRFGLIIAIGALAVTSTIAWAGVAQDVGLVEEFLRLLDGRVMGERAYQRLSDTERQEHLLVTARMLGVPVPDDLRGQPDMTMSEMASAIWGQLSPAQRLTAVRKIHSYVNTTQQEDLEPVLSMQAAVGPVASADQERHEAGTPPPARARRPSTDADTLGSPASSRVLIIRDAISTRDAASSSAGEGADSAKKLSSDRTDGFTAESAPITDKDQGRGFSAGTALSAVKPEGLSERDSKDAPAVGPDHVLGPRDRLEVVWLDSESSPTGLSGTAVVVEVSLLGTISLPRVGSIKVGGRRLGEVEEVLARAHRPFAAQPRLSLAVRDIQSRKIYVVGEVSSSGVVPLPHASTTIGALFSGTVSLTARADRHRIAVVREGRTIEVDLDRTTAASEGEAGPVGAHGRAPLPASAEQAARPARGPDALFELAPGDRVVVPSKRDVERPAPAAALTSDERI